MILPNSGSKPWAMDLADILLEITAPWPEAFDDTPLSEIPLRIDLPFADGAPVPITYWDDAIPPEDRAAMVAAFAALPDTTREQVGQYMLYRFYEYVEEAASGPEAAATYLTWLYGSTDWQALGPAPRRIDEIWPFAPFERVAVEIFDGQPTVTVFARVIWDEDHGLTIPFTGGDEFDPSPFFALYTPAHLQ